MAILSFNTTEENQISRLNLVNNKIYVLDNGYEPLVLSPSLSMTFNHDFSTTEYSNRYLKNTIHHLYKQIYSCGDDIKVVNYESYEIEIINSRDEAPNDHFYNHDDKHISIGREMTTPLALVHEILHAIIAKVEDHLGEQPIAQGECGLLNIHANGSPGMMMDIKSRLYMHFGRDEVDHIPEGQFYLPFQHGYPNAEAYCFMVNERRRNFNLNIDLDSNPDFVSAQKRRFRKKLKPISKEAFYKLKFETEANFLSSIKGFGDKGLTVEKYIDINMKNAFKK